MERKLKTISIILAILAGISILACLLSNKTERVITITDVTTEYVCYYSAEYSETSLDFDGSIDTDSWSELASDEYYVKSHNGEIETNAPNATVFTCDKPIKWNDIEQSDLDGVYFHENLKIKVYYTYMKKGEEKYDYKTISKDEYDFFFNKLGDTLNVKMNIAGTF